MAAVRADILEQLAVSTHRQQALDFAQRMMEAVQDRLDPVMRGWMPPEALREDYFQHRVLLYQDKPAVGRPTRLRLPSGEKIALGSVRPLEHDYLKVQIGYLAEHYWKKVQEDFAHHT